MFSLYAENIKVIENKTISSIDISDTLHIGYGSKISEVIMDTENTTIKSIILEGTAFIQDYSFISKCKNLETLVMNDIKVTDLSFLEKCKNLKILSFDSVSFIKFPEINKMENLDYLGITNCNLEQLAQEIFKNCFVGFEPFGDKMPDGWRMGKLSDIAEITMGQSSDGKSNNENGIVFYQGRAEFGTRFPTRRLFTTEPKRMAKQFDTLMSVRAPVGDTNIAYEVCCIGRGLAAIHSKDNHQSFVHYTVLALRSKLDLFF